MSPLARSLLALTATLAIASVQPRRSDGACSTADLGEGDDPARDYTQGPMTFDCSRQEIEPPNHCADGYHHCGEHIEACNTDSDGPAPRISVAGGALASVTVTCKDPKKKKMTVTIIEHCCKKLKNQDVNVNINNA